MELLFWLLVGHALGDFALQSDWMARHKSRHCDIEGISSKRPNWIWYHVLSAHCMIHAGLVALITGVVWLGIAEFMAHWLIDFCKSENKFGFNTDQLLHVCCKLLWIAVLVAMGLPLTVSFLS